MDEREQLLECARQSAPAIKELADCENKYLKLFEKETKFKKREGWVWLGMILCPLLVLGAIIFIITGKEPSAKTLGTDLTMCVVLGGIGAFCIWRFMTHLKRKNELAEASAKVDRAQDNPALSWIPPKYRITTYIGKIIEYLQNMRAKTLQEAINLLETEIHQATMENLAAIGAINGSGY